MIVLTHVLLFVLVAGIQAYTGYNYHGSGVFVHGSVGLMEDKENARF